MGTSWAITRARQCILFELHYEESKLHQAEFRIRRIGQKYKTKFIRYHLKKSIDSVLNDGSLFRKYFQTSVKEAPKGEKDGGLIKEEEEDAKYRHMPATVIDNRAA